MKNFIKFLGIILLACPPSSWAQKFDHFELTPKLKHLLNSPQITDSTSAESNELDGLLMPKQLHSFSNYNVSDLAPMQSQGWDRIIKFILPFLMSEGHQLSWEELEKLLSWRRNFSLGVENFNNMQWTKPFGYVDIASRRDFVNLGPDNIEVTDTLELTIDAQSLLKTLRDNGLIDIAESSISAFAQLKYHKIYQFKHYAKSLEEAQLADLKTLLIPFQFLNFPEFLQLKPGEQISNKDLLSLGIKGSASIRFYQFIKAEIAVEGTLERCSDSTIKVIQDANGQQIYQLKKERGTTARLDISASVALDFFKLINLTLLKVDYQFQSTSSKTSYYQAPYEYILEPNTLDNHLVGDRTYKAKMSSIGNNFLVWGNSKGTQQSVEKIQNSTQKLELHHTWWAKDKYIQSLFGGLVNNLMGDILSAFLGFNKKFSAHEEYDLVRSADNKIFNLKFSRSLYLDKRKSLWTNGKSKLVGTLVQNHSLLPSDVKLMWWQGWIQKNILLQDNFELSSNAMDNLRKLSRRDLSISSIMVCNLENHPSVDLSSPIQLIQWNDLTWKQQSCVKSAYEKLKLISDTDDKEKQWKYFSDFIKIFFANAQDSDALFAIFSPEDLQQTTTIHARDHSGERFLANYNRSMRKQFSMSDLFLSQQGIWR